VYKRQVPDGYAQTYYDSQALLWVQERLNAGEEGGI
jgi:hypothetical protein